MVFQWFSNRRAAGPPMAMARSAEGANAPTARPRLDEATFRILWFKAMEKMVILTIVNDSFINVLIYIYMDKNGMMDDYSHNPCK